MQPSSSSSPCRQTFSLLVRDARRVVVASSSWSKFYIVVGHPKPHLNVFDHEYKSHWANCKWGDNPLEEAAAFLFEQQKGLQSQIVLFLSCRCPLSSQIPIPIAIINDQGLFGPDYFLAVVRPRRLMNHHSDQHRCKLLQCGCSRSLRSLMMRQTKKPNLPRRRRRSERKRKTSGFGSLLPSFLGFFISSFRGSRCSRFS